MLSSLVGATHRGRSSEERVTALVACLTFGSLPLMPHLSPYSSHTDTAVTSDPMARFDIKNRTTIVVQIQLAVRGRPKSGSPKVGVTADRVGPAHVSNNRGSANALRTWNVQLSNERVGDRTGQTGGLTHVRSSVRPSQTSEGTLHGNEVTLRCFVVSAARSPIHEGEHPQGEKQDAAWPRNQFLEIRGTYTAQQGL